MQSDVTLSSKFQSPNRSIDFERASPLNLSNHGSLLQARPFRNPEESENALSPAPTSQQDPTLTVQIFADDSPIIDNRNASTPSFRLHSDPKASADSPNSGPAAMSAAKMSEGASPAILKFSIENILRDDFGAAARLSRASQRAGRLKAFETPPASFRRHSSSESSSSPTTTSSLNSPTTPVSAAAPPLLWPAWVYCTRYSDRPSAGPRKRKAPKEDSSPSKSNDLRMLGFKSAKSAPSKYSAASRDSDEKRPRTAFSPEQLARLKTEFCQNRYLTEKRRVELSRDLDLNESQIKIWFQNKRAKIKKQSGYQTELALHLMSQGLYNHSGNTRNNSANSFRDSGDEDFPRDVEDDDCGDLGKNQ